MSSSSVPVPVPVPSRNIDVQDSTEEEEDDDDDGSGDEDDEDDEDGDDGEEDEEEEWGELAGRCLYLCLNMSSAIATILTQAKNVITVSYRYPSLLMLDILRVCSV